MKLLSSLILLLGVAVAAPPTWNPIQPSNPVVIDSSRSLTYVGLFRSGVEAFLGIQYGQDTGGQNRFKVPQPYVYKAGSTVTATTYGPACPQTTYASFFPIYLSNYSDISENCLLLNVKRPNGTSKDAKLPVMVFIHGGSFNIGSKDEIVSEPSGLVQQSVLNGLPVIAVNMNYRLSSFGFAYTAALQKEGSTNVGLRDQRLAIEWVRDNIAAFGGDPNKITIYGQSSGGLAIGLQILAYGGSKPVPFQQGIGESQILEGGITGNFTRTSMTNLLTATGCNTTDFDSPATIACLRSLTMQQQLDAQIATYSSDASANLGDSWMPGVDGDFIPDAPSNLIPQGKFANVTAMIGWTQGDLDFIIPPTVRTTQDSDQYLRDYLPGFNETSIQSLFALYPFSEFRSNEPANLTQAFYRTSRVVRDIVMVCMPFFYGDAITKKSNNVYLYMQNQTFLNPIWTSLGFPNIGVGHTSEFAYVFGNLSNYNVDDFPFLPNATDYALLQRESRTWSSFASTGHPSLVGKTTLQGWTPAFAKPNERDIFVIGGSQEGLFAQTNGANAELNGEQLEKRCAFLNNPDIIKQLNY